MPQQYLESVSQFDQTVNPLFTFLGIQIIELAPDKAVLELVIKPELIQGAGKAAGGVLATLLDEAMAHAVLSGNAPGQFTTTVNMNVSYYKPVQQNDTLICTANVTKRGSRIAFTEATITIDSTPVAQATASFMMV